MAAMSTRESLEQYFKRYGESFRDGDQLAGFYGDCAMASTPAFVGCLKGSEEIRAALAGVAQGQIETGMTHLAPLKVEATDFDPLHCWAKVRWGAHFEKTKDRLVEFDISYLLRLSGDRYQILIYVAHQDEQAMRQELGLA